MTPLQVSQLIEAAVGQIANLIFLRATDAEANVEVDDIDLSVDNVAIYNNRPDITAATSDESGQVEVEHPIEILVVGLAEFDDNDVDADVISDPLYSIAEELFDRVSGGQGSVLTFSDGYAIDLGSAVKLYDKVLTGVTLSFSIYYSRAIKCY